MVNIELLKKVIETDIRLTLNAARNTERPDVKKSLTWQASAMKSVLMMIEDENHLLEMAKIYGIE